MFNFETPQKTYEIGNVKIGGQPGKNPTVLIGSLFYKSQKILINEKKGIVDKDKTEAVINLQENFSDITGNPCMIDLVCSTDEAVVSFLDIVSELTDIPLLIDSPSYKVRIAGLKHATDIGLIDRVIYNSLTLESKPDEYEAIQKNKIESALLLAYQSGFLTSKNRVQIIKDLLSYIEQYRIKKPLIDTSVIDVPTLSVASKAIMEIKMETGLPCGCGAHNAISTWFGFKKRMGVQAVIPCETAVNIYPIVYGADFILYGPIESSKYIFPAVATINSAIKFLRKTGELIII